MKNLINSVRVIVNAQFTRLCIVIKFCFKSDLNFFTLVIRKNIISKFFSNLNDKDENKKNENENKNEFFEKSLKNENEKNEKNINDVDETFDNDDENDEKNDFSDL